VFAEIKNNLKQIGALGPSVYLALGGEPATIPLEGILKYLTQFGFLPLGI
jgi:hypothetical protein